MTRLTLILALLTLATSACGLLIDDAARIERAEQALGRGEYRAAILDLRSALQNNPDNLRARLLLGSASLAVGDARNAAMEFRQAQRLGAPAGQYALPLAKALAVTAQYAELLELPAQEVADADRATMHALRGEALMASGRPGEALAEYREALQREPENQAAQIGIVETYLAAGNIDAAEQALREVTDRSGAAVGVLTGRVALARGDAAAAEAALERALGNRGPAEWESTDVPAVLVLVEARISAGELDAARTTVERLLELAPSLPVVLYQRARVAYESGDYERAEQDLTQVLQLAPDLVLAKRLFGASAYRAGKLETANMYLASALASDPEDATARRLLTEVRLRLNQPGDALVEVRRGVEQGDADAALLALGGQASLALGRPEDAVAYLEEAVAADSANGELRLQLAQAYVVAGRTAEASRTLAGIGADDPTAFRRDLMVLLTELDAVGAEQRVERARRLLETWPDSADAYVFVASLEIAAERERAARELLDRALALDPNHVAANDLLGRIAYRAGDLPAAIRYFEAIKRSDPTNEGAYLALAQIAIAQGRAQSALAQLNEGRVANPRAVVIRQELAKRLLAAGDGSAALVVVTEAIALAPNLPLLLDLGAASQFAVGNVREGMRWLQQAATLAPDAVPHQLSLAKGQIATQDWQGAERTLARALDLDASNVEALLLLGRLDQRAGRTAAALARAREVEARQPNNPTVHALLGSVWFAQGDLARAEDAYARSLALESSTEAAVQLHLTRSQLGAANSLDPLFERLRDAPEDNATRLVLAAARQTRGEFPEAVAEYERLLARQPNNAIALNNVAWLYHLAGDSRAVESARNAVTLQPDNGAIIDTLGWILVEQGSIDDGLPLVRRAASLLPDDGEVRYHLGAALLRRGDREQARSVLTALLDTQIEFPSRDAAVEMAKSL